MSMAPADCRRSIARTNPRYYRLIEAFRDLTGVPMVLNTSFNENEPVVCTPAEALECFLRTRMDVLVLGDTIVNAGAGMKCARASSHHLNVSLDSPGNVPIIFLTKDRSACTLKRACW